MKQKDYRYSDIYLKKEDLEDLLMDKVTSIDLNLILSAYEMSENLCAKHLLPLGTDFFYHATRIVKILTEELNIFDPEIITAALLHDAYKLSKDVTPLIIDYNFGSYVAFLVEILYEGYEYLAKFPNGLQPLIKGETTIVPDDYLLLMCAEHLDHFRCLDYDFTGKYFEYLREASMYMFPIIEKNSNEKIKYLYLEMIKQRNKLLS